MSLLYIVVFFEVSVRRMLDDDAVKADLCVY